MGPSSCVADLIRPEKHALEALRVIVVGGRVVGSRGAILIKARWTYRVGVEGRFGRVEAATEANVWSLEAGSFSGVDERVHRLLH